MRTVNQNMSRSEYLTDAEHRKLGHLQIDMLAFIRKNCKNDPKRRFSIARDSTTRRVAQSLHNRGLIKIVDTAYECWTIVLVH